MGQGGVMRLYAITTAVLMAATFVGVSGTNAFADTTNNAGATPAQKYVTVQTGDYLSAIAVSNNTTYVRIFNANEQIQSPDLIYPGEVLRIPAASEQLANRTMPADTGAAVVQPQIPEDNETSEVQPTAPAVASPPAPAEQSTNIPVSASGSIWDELAQCESGGDWSIDTGNSFYGGLQFTLSSWYSVGGTGYPNQASRDEQIMRAELLQARQGWGAWPVCSAKIGL